MKSLNLITYFMKAYPWRSALMIGFLVFSGFAEGVSILTLLPLVELVTSGSISGNSKIGIFVRDALGFVGLEPSLAGMLCLIVFGIVLKNAFMFLAMKQAGYTVAYVMTDLRLKLIRALLVTRWSYFVSQKAGFFTNAISTEASRASSAYQHAVLLIAGVIQVLIYGAAALLLSWQITLGSLVIAVLLLFLLAGFIKMSRRAGDRQTEVMKSLTARLTDALQGIKPIKAMAREFNLQYMLEAETQELNAIQQRFVIAGELLKALQEPLLMVILSVGIYVAITFGNYPFSMLLIMVVLFNRAVNRIYSVQSYAQGIVAGESALWSLLESIRSADLQKEEESGGHPLPSFRRQVSLDSVTFSYGERNILNGVSLVIPAGEFVALTGPSGEGKTTIADLIIGLFWPQTGSVHVDGTPLRELNLCVWRRMIGYVPQEMFLFHDSVFNNVSLGDKDITREAIRGALQKAGAWDFVAALPEGIDTVIGERGSKLSGGQRQRISIARALVHKPALLILDEVTTALDPKTEAALCGTLKKLHGEVSILAISHQAAMIEIADRVYRIKNSFITEEGGFGQVLPETALASS